MVTLHISSVYCVPNIIEVGQLNICRNYSHMKKVGVFGSQCIVYLCNELTVFTAAASSGHQSVKKGGVKPPPLPPSATVTHISVDRGSDNLADDDIERSVEQPSVLAASLVIAALIVIPLTIVLLVTVCARLYRQGSAFITLVVS